MKKVSIGKNPDFTGYYFLFNQDETQQFFKVLTNHLQ